MLAPGQLREFDFDLDDAGEAIESTMCAEQAATGQTRYQAPGLLGCGSRRRFAARRARIARARGG